MWVDGNYFGRRPFASDAVDLNLDRLHRPLSRPEVHFFCGRGQRIAEYDSGTVYTFHSVKAGFCVDVAVPSDSYMRSAETTALQAALAGMVLPGRSQVLRRKVVA